MVTTASNPFPLAGPPSHASVGRHRSEARTSRARRWAAGALAPLVTVGGGMLVLPAASAAVGEGRSLEADYGIEMVILGGYDPGVDVTVQVVRDGDVIGEVTTPTLADGSLEIHHGGGGQFPAGDCWGLPYTPDIRPGDEIRASQGTYQDATVVRDVFIDTENVQYDAAAGTITVRGHARDLDGAPIEEATDALSILLRFPIDVSPVPPEGPSQSLSRSDRVGDEINDELDAFGNFTHTFTGYSSADIQAIEENPGTEVIAEWGAAGVGEADPNELTVYSGDAGPLGGCPPYAPADQTPPSQVTGVVASQPAAGWVELDWEAASDNVGVTGYVITRTNLDTGAETTASVGGTELFWSQSRVADGRYSYTVHAVDATGNAGLKSAAVLVGVGVAAPPAAPTGLSATVTAGGSVDLSWSAPTTGTTPVSYQVLRGTSVIANTVTGTTHTDPGPGAGTHSYTVRSRAADGSLSPASDPPATATVEATATVPAAPTGVTAAAGNASATVGWTAGSDGGSAITSWRVQVRTGTTVVRTVTGIAADARSTVITGLTNGTAYNFRVRAVNAVGLGTLSAASAAVTPTGTTTATVPGRTVIGTAVAGVAGGAITATANWSPPTSDGGSAITGYVIRALRMNADGTVAATTVSAVQPATARSLSMTLPVAGNYRFTAQARNAVGAGQQSLQSNMVAGR